MTLKRDTRDTATLGLEISKGSGRDAEARSHALVRTDLARFDKLLQDVQQQPWSHDFYAVLRRIEALHADRPRLGKALRPRDEPLRLGQDAELDFAVASLSSLRVNASGKPRLGQRFFGLFGPMGPMPLHLSEYVRDRERQHADPALARFADTFHHRSLLLFYRAWAQSQPAVHLDRRSDDAFSRWIGAVAGLAQPEFEHADSLAVDAKRHRAAILARSAKTAEGLTKLLRGWFDVPVRLESYVGQWLHTREEDRTRLVRRNHPQPRNVLGHSAVAGDRVWDRQYKFRLHLGPLTLAQYRQFLPGQCSITELRDWVRQYVGLGLAFDVVTHLVGAQVPRLALGGRRAASPQLGWTTWLGKRGAHADRSDLRLSPARLSRFKDKTHG
jgi:type VI secretion system protein ImpH